MLKTLNAEPAEPADKKFQGFLCVLCELCVQSRLRRSSDNGLPGGSRRHVERLVRVRDQLHVRPPAPGDVTSGGVRIEVGGGELRPASIGDREGPVLIQELDRAVW